jgi:hypothetical protein
LNQNRMSDINDLHAFASRLGEKIIASGTRGDFGGPAWDDQTFNQLALELFELQFSQNPAYRRFCESRGVAPGMAGDWASIPAIPTEAFKELTLSCIPEAGRDVVFHSSGTIGQRPSRHFHSRSSIALYEISLWSWFAPHLLPPREAQPGWLLVLTPGRETAPHSSLVHMLEHIASRSEWSSMLFACRTAEDGTWEIKGPEIIEFLENAASSGRTGLLLSTAFGLVQLADLLAAEGRRFELPAGSRAMETGGYKGRSRTLPKAELHRAITRWLGIPANRIVSEYGMSELSSQAYDHTAGSLLRAGERVFHFPPWARAQLVSPETSAPVGDGETGLLRVFDLANVFSVAAVQTGDLGVRRGHGFELIGRAENREPRGCSLMAGK